MLTTYPTEPGFRNKTEPTSFQAAKAVKESAKTIREWAYGKLIVSDLTVQEIAKRLWVGETNTADYVRFEHSVQSRVSELRAAGKVEPTELRRKNESGQNAVVWRTTRKPVKYTQPNLI